MDGLLSCGVSYAEALTKLQELKNTPYSVTFVPAEVVESFDSERKDWEFQKYAKVQYDILQLQLKFGVFSRGGTLRISNTEKAKRGYIFQHCEVIASELPKKTTTWKVSDTLRKVQDAMLCLSPHKQMSGTNKKKCYLCRQRPVAKLSVQAEAAFYRKHHISTKVAQAYRRLTNGLGAQVFHPFNKVYEEQKRLKGTHYLTGLVELNKSKKSENSEEGAVQKLTVPYLCVSNLSHAVLQKLLQSDREGSYFRHKFQKANTWEVLFAGDAGADSTKFGFFNTREEKFNTGQNFCVAHMVEKAPDTQENLRTCYANHIAPEFVELQNSSIVRVRSQCQKKVAGAIIKTRFPFAIPTLFMKWNTCANVDSSEEHFNAGRDTASDTNFESEFVSITEQSKQSCNKTIMLEDEQGQYLKDIALELEKEEDNFTGVETINEQADTITEHAPVFDENDNLKLPSIDSENNVLQVCNNDQSFKGENYAYFIRVVEGTVPNTQQLYSVVVANLGGSQMTSELWQIVASFLVAECPPNTNSNRMQLFYSFQDPSDDFLGA